MRCFGVIALLPVLAVVGSCSDEESGSGGPAGPGATAPAEPGPPTVTDALTLTRTDGSSVEVDGPFTVECDEEAPDTGATAVRVTTPFYDGGPRGDLGAYLVFFPELVGAGGVTYELPPDEDVEDSDALIVFFYDGDNEISSAVEGSTGTVRVVEATCDPVPRLVIEVDATIGSEIDGEDPVEVTGGLDLTGE